MKILARLSAALLSVLLCGAIAQADGLSAGTAYKANPVQGTTAAALWRYMLAHPIIDPDDGPAFANITHDHKLTFNTTSAGGLCRVTGLDFTWSFVITLPKAVSYAGMDAATKRMWDQFTAYLKKHEEEHRAIFMGCGKSFVPAASKLTGLPGCLGMERQVRAFVDRQYAACMDRQRAFDRGQKATVAGLAFVRAAQAAGLPAGKGF
jgi:predicted secreted Zn-dependent protease